MAGLTGEIERYLLLLLDEESDGILEIGRNEIAQRFNCAPSQINYVLTTRFTPYKGYYIESRRGGSGYIRISRLERDPDETISKLINNVVKDSITADKGKHVLRALQEQDAITERECIVMEHAIDDNSLRDIPLEHRNQIRAKLLQNMLLAYLRF